MKPTSKHFWTSLVLVYVGLALYVTVCKADTVIVDAAGIRICYPRCPRSKPPATAPMIKVRHGLYAYWDGASDGPERIVDLDTRQLSIVQFGYERLIDGEFQEKKIICRRDIFLVDDDLKKIKTIIDSIWASNHPIPTPQAGLGGGWFVTLVDGEATRHDSGMGVPGAQALELARLLSTIQSEQGTQFVRNGRRWFEQNSSYENLSGVHVDLPKPHFITGQRSLLLRNEEEAMSTERPDFQFRYEAERNVCDE